MTIKITEEYESAYIKAAHGDYGQVTASVVAGLKAVAVLIERDYTVTGGPVPDDVIQVTNVDGDVWDKLADGRWVCVKEQIVLDIERIREKHGPVTW